MKYEFSYAAFGFQDRDIFAALEAIATSGFTQTELLGQQPHMEKVPNGRDLAVLRQALESTGIHARTIHAPMGKNVLGAPDEDWRLEVAENLSDFIRFAGELGASDLIIHPVPNPIFVPADDTPSLSEQMRSSFLRSLDALVPIAMEADVRMLLENLPYDCNYPLLSLAELRPMIETYPADYVGLVVDTGHTVVAGRDPVDEIVIAGERLYGTHLQDTDGLEDRHWAPGEGVIDWDAVCRVLVDIGYSGPWTFETRYSRDNGAPEFIIEKARAAALQWKNTVLGGHL